MLHNLGALLVNDEGLLHLVLPRGSDSEGVGRGEQSPYGIIHLILFATAFCCS